MAGWEIDKELHYVYIRKVEISLQSKQFACHIDVCIRDNAGIKNIIAIVRTRH